MSEESQSQTMATSSNGHVQQRQDSAPTIERKGSDTNGTVVELPSIDEEKGSGIDEATTLQAPVAVPLMDSGRDAWMTVAGAFLVQFCTFGYVSAFGVYQDYYTREFLTNATPSDISWIGSFQLFMQYLLCLFVGRAFDAGYFRPMIAAGAVLQVLCMFMLSLAHKGSYYQVFLAQALGMGLGQGLLFLPSITVIGHHFKRRRAFATGICVSGVSFGGIIWPIVLNQLSQRTTFANAIRGTATLTAVLLFLSYFLMKPRTRPTSAPAFPSPKIMDILRDSAYTVSISGAFCIGLGLYFPYFYLQLYAVDLGVSKNLAFYVVAILNAGSVFGRILPNFFADKLGAYNMLLLCLVCSAVLAWIIFAVTTFASIVAFGILYGFFSGSYLSLIPSLLVQFSAHPGEQGTRMGIAFAIVGTALLIGSPIEGVLLHPRSESGEMVNVYVWWRSIVFCGIMILCGIVGMAVSRWIFVRAKRGGARGQWV